MDQAEIEKRVEGLSPEQARRVVCALSRHSRIVTTCMGYIYCARCEDQIGDSLGGAGSTANAVIVGHDCDSCRENAKSLTWQDTFLSPDPFDPEKVREQKEAREAFEKFKADRAEAS